MAQFTVITEESVIRLNAKSIQAATQALNASGIVFIGIDRDKD